MSSLTIGAFAKKAYLDYAMYVVLDRALPHVFDGLKPVQRRIVYAMHLLLLSAKAKYKKSSRTVGDVLGKFHPHGDTACYEAMVILAQWFNTRYPLIDGQGNWGSLDDPHSFAAMRYTEARLTVFAQSLLDEVGAGGVQWGPNFDGTLKEPQVLPAQLPQILLNGAYGIAVGMTTNIPPHNCKEVADACAALLDDSEMSDEDLFACVPGPDFPTGAECINTAESLRELYLSGEGTLRLRASYHLEGGALVFDQLPFRVSPARVLTQIAQEMQAKRLPQVVDLRDESDHDAPVRIVLELKSRKVDVEMVCQHLFVSTDLEKQDRVVFNAIGADRNPSLFSLRALLLSWIAQRKMMVVDRSKARLEKVLSTLHILEGLLVVFANLDEVIAIIRAHEHPSKALQERFSLSEKQAEAILEIKLRALAKLKDLEIFAQKKALEEERDFLQGVIHHPEKLTALVKKELLGAAERYQDSRRTKLVERKASVAPRSGESRPVVDEPVSFIISRQGWGRVAKGHVDASGIGFRVGDALLGVYHGSTVKRIMLASLDGRFFTLTHDAFPGARTQGAPLSQFLDLGASITLPYVFWERQADVRWLLVSNEGYGFYSEMEDLVSRLKSGKQVMTGKGEGFEMLSPVPLESGHTHVALLANTGRMLIVAIGELAYLKKGKGQKLLGLSEGEKLLFFSVFGASDRLAVHSGRRVFTLTPGVWQAYVGKRGRKGKSLPKGFVSVQKLVVDRGETC